jgi:hypothetical protein
VRLHSGQFQQARSFDDLRIRVGADAPFGTCNIDKLERQKVADGTDPPGTNISPDTLDL